MYMMHTAEWYGWVWGAFTTGLVAIRLGDGGSSSEGRSPVCTQGHCLGKPFSLQWV